MNEQKHTQYIICGDAKQFHKNDAWFVVIRTGHKKHITIEAPTKEEAETNAALIVKAVNNHDKLVEALKRMVEEFDGVTQIPSEQDAVINAIAALKEAEGGEQL